MAVPVVAIVGRPNVGKSSLFNWLAGRRIAIVDPTAGVTRDRVTTLIKIGERFVELVDTGGMGIKDVDNLTAHIERQIDVAIDEAAVILFVVDAREGLMPLDEKVAARLRYVNKPILCVANKCDAPAIEPQAAEFYKLGRGKLVCVSTKEKRGKEELLSLIAERLPPSEGREPEPETQLKLAIVGRRNTGKSTFINSLAQSERMIVSEVPGTTRDSVDVRFQRDGKVFVAIDTAGVRRRQSLASDIEFYSMHRAERSIRRADVVLLFFDPRVRVSKVDKQLVDYILEHHKPAIFVVNKWDLVTERQSRLRHLRESVAARLAQLPGVPLVTVSALGGDGLDKLKEAVFDSYARWNRRVPTPALNRWLAGALERHTPPAARGRRIKIRFMTQPSARPPTFVAFCSQTQALPKAYVRYLTNSLRETFDLPGVPIRFRLRKGGNPFAGK